MDGHIWETELQLSQSNVCKNAPYTQVGQYMMYNKTTVLTAPSVDQIRRRYVLSKLRYEYWNCWILVNFNFFNDQKLGKYAKITQVGLFNVKSTSPLVGGTSICNKICEYDETGDDNIRILGRVGYWFCICY